MKKILIFGGVIVLIFAALAFVTTSQNKQKAEGNPYGKANLNPSTIAQLDDPNYQNLILPDELDEKLENGEDVTVYFYSPDCGYCKEVTPRLAPLAEDLNVDMVQFNLLEFNEGWNKYRIEATPTLIQYKDGEFYQGIRGAASTEEYEQFFRQYTLNEEE
ncbi:thioredoxin [Alkalihalobacillus alcalophilus ATCC 27647 = CGMCC 1.3604]|uniref:Thioredoxin n=1 Tax=Alkalihalobacillus alcalophilus ATCC 27647 = CGMCC 1.3604 TaxID=1218173 RepID=A0A094XIY2_ALKAL|nr:thioredoxin family protein [Alkalihalobacillus alcalophilus]KGA98705.1 thioredoxin [Alkalihalobacillus alcalophilus ATCC 27647 = CGMCC 1.3604]MED1560332.1 thioredoxin family protein [Alkalihalobacillus alcalophilus]THG89777.1 thioredoxin [Alkalihalobacillus alcalophilus ATCC 27647 = CGMCC 1.3604]